MNRLTGMTAASSALVVLVSTVAVGSRWTLPLQRMGLRSSNSGRSIVVALTQGGGSPAVGAVASLFHASLVDQLQKDNSVSRALFAHLNRSEAVASAAADGKGYVYFEPVADGNYYILIEAPQRRICPRLSPIAAETINVRGDNTLHRRIVVDIPNRPAVTGAVFDSAGNPVPGACVMALPLGAMALGGGTRYPRSAVIDLCNGELSGIAEYTCDAGGSQRLVMTQEDGTFAIDGLDAVAYSVVAGRWSVDDQRILFTVPQSIALESGRTNNGAVFSFTEIVPLELEFDGAEGDAANQDAERGVLWIVAELAQGKYPIIAVHTVRESVIRLPRGVYSFFYSDAYGRRYAAASGVRVDGEGGRCRLHLVPGICAILDGNEQNGAMERAAELWIEGSCVGWVFRRHLLATRIALPKGDVRFRVWAVEKGEWSARDVTIEPHGRPGVEPIALW